MKLLIFGRDGQLGLQLAERLSGLGELRALGRAQADLSDPARVARLIEQERPDYLINAAAYTAVDRAETDEAAAQVINALTPGVMAAAAQEIGAVFIHYSTDYVFDGAAGRAYLEDDAPAPLNAYGRTKLAGEREIARHGGRHFILRTSWVYSEYGRNFLLTVLRLARERPELRIVADQTGAPTYAGALADGTRAMIAAIERRERAVDDLSGVYHMTCDGETTWYGFTRAIVDRLALPAKVTPIATADYPLPARRPAYSVLDHGKLARVFGIRLPHWEAALGECLASLPAHATV